MTITFSAHSDDYNIELTNLDCTSYFEQASDPVLQRLADVGWRNSYSADDVAVFYRDTTCKRLFDYLDFVNEYPNRDLGFDVVVNEVEALSWIKERRPPLYRTITKQQNVT